jgi:beta-1,4-mannosyl-glycoprotein beta-1,4-N-acetylglucosaminyltransferase
MIYDCFLYNGENECLETRIKELSGLPVMHILVEGSHTFTNIKRRSTMPMKFALMANMYHCIVQMPLFDNPWDNEKYQRNCIADSLVNVGCFDDDVVIISDCDEIPNAKAVEEYLNKGSGRMKLAMDDYVLHINQLVGKQEWIKPDIMQFKDLTNSTPDLIRNSGAPTLSNGGWHFSWLGEMERILDKFASFSHQEEAVQSFADRNLIADKMAKGEYLFSDKKCEIVEIGYDSHPRHIVDNQHKYQHLIWKTKGQL